MRSSTKCILLLEVRQLIWYCGLAHSDTATFAIHRSRVFNCRDYLMIGHTELWKGSACSLLINDRIHDLLNSCAGDSAGSLESLRLQAMGAVLPLTRGYIWQKDAFNLQSSAGQQPPWRQAASAASSKRANGAVPCSAGGASGLASFREGPLPCLWGAVQFGDNLEDEWFTAWLLRELTARIPGAAARVWDNDGEFLLIEAAYSLPRWLKPETAANR